MDVRQAVDAGTTAFIDVVATWTRRLDLDALTVFARWITPPLTPKRFDTWFYAVNAPAEQLAACDGRETVDAEWIAPSEALRLAGGGRAQGDLPDPDEPAAAGRGERGATDAVARAKARGRWSPCSRRSSAAIADACWSCRPTPATAWSRSRCENVM